MNREIKIGVIFITLVAFAAILIIPAVALQPLDEKSYTMGPVDIDAAVDAAGVMSVSERRTFDFDGHFTCVFWTFPSGDEYTIGDVSIVADGNTVRLTEVPFQTEWRYSGGPGENKYSIDRYLGDISIYAFFDAADERITVELNYTLEIVQTYSDIAELYWQFIGSDWSVESSDVSLTITLPAPAGVSVAEGDIRAWGHGDPEGSVWPHEDGTVTYDAPIVRSYRFAEARVAFPVEWVGGMPIQNDRDRLDEIIEEETYWNQPVDGEYEEMAYVLMAFDAAFIIVIIYVSVLFFRKGREYKPQFDEKYWRDAPSNDHPAVLGSLWRWGRAGTEEFTATLMRLTNMGVITLERNASGGKNDYSLKINRSAATGLTDPIDAKAVYILFTKISGGADAVSIDEIGKYGEKNGSVMCTLMENWKDAVKHRVKERGYIESGSTDRSKTVFTFGLFILFMAVFLLNIINDGAPGTFDRYPALPIIPFVAGVCVMAIGVFIKRRSRAGNELHAKCVALRNWLRDFTDLKEAVPEDVTVWNQYLVFATIFGVADDVVKQLKVSMPELVENMANNPAYMWAYPGAGISPAVVMSRAMANASAGAGNSGGFGGGFSGGGGGGFGGGGGGAR